MKKIWFCLAAGAVYCTLQAQEPAASVSAVVSADSSAVTVPAVVSADSSAVAVPAVVSADAVSAADSLTAEHPAPDGKIGKYRRSSLYTVLIRHPEAKYGQSIDSAFLAIPTPDKFNDHNLPVRSFDAGNAPRQRKGNARNDYNRRTIDRFIDEQAVPRGMVAKWFDRDSLTGAFDMALIQQRGSYDASQLDIRLADQSALGRATLADAGEMLIGKTFLLVNDITFVDKGEKSKAAGGWLRLIGSIAGAATNTDVSDLTETTVALVNEIDGFSVNITSYLYRLQWNDEVAATFYQDYWTDASSPDVARRCAFDTTGLFKLTYVGQTSTSAGNLSSRSFSRSKEEQMLKVSTRAIDKSIVQLQRDFDEFKVNVPLYRINGDGTVDVQIGLKEGINSRSQFDVLLPVEDEQGRTTYQKVGRLQPVEGRIWDNRFGADEEAAAQAAEQASAAQTAASTGMQVAAQPAVQPSRGGIDPALKNGDEPLGNVSLTATTFRILSGANKIMPGCLVREVTIKREK